MDEDTSQPNLDEWVKRISEREMPIFGSTAHDVSMLAQDERAPVSSLTQAILHDTAMTAKVLKLANSAYFNSARQSISTISRAIVVLGFDTVRSMTISVALIDTLLLGGPRRRVFEEMARSFHAAVQARSAAIAARDSSPEEVFIAALLAHLGEMAFWCFSGKQGEELDNALNEPGITAIEAEEKVLGFRLNQLTASLAQEWRLNPLLQNFAQGKISSGSREQGIDVSYKLAHAAEKGWDSAESKKAIAEFAKYTGVSVDAAVKMVNENATEAARVASYYGAVDAAKLIPPPPGKVNPAVAEAEAIAAGRLAPGMYLEPDPMLQLKILRELSILLATKPNINALLEMVLEGIYRGIGMDRTLFALLTPDRAMLKAKYALGEDRVRATETFQFPIDKKNSDLIYEVIERQKSFLVEDDKDPAIAKLVTPKLRAMTGGSTFMVTPIAINERSIGLFYADRHASGRPIDEEAYQSFKHFAQQANLGLGHMATRR